MKLFKYLFLVFMFFNISIVTYAKTPAPSTFNYEEWDYWITFYTQDGAFINEGFDYNDSVYSYLYNNKYIIVVDLNDESNSRILPINYAFYSNNNKVSEYNSVLNPVYNTDMSYTDFNCNFIVFNSLDSLLYYKNHGKVQSYDNLFYLPNDFIIDEDGNVLDKPDPELDGSYNQNIPNMVGTKIIPETKGKATTNYITSWKNQNTTYNVDIMVTYSYKTSIFGSVKYKNVMVKDYFDNIKDSNGTYLLKRSDMLSVAKVDNPDDDNVFGGDNSYGFTKVYLRYSNFENGKYRYGNWRYITVYNGQQGIIEYGSGDTTLDENGNIIENPIDSRGDENGTPINDGSSFGDLLNGLVNAPSVIASIGNGISSIVAGVGQVPLALASLFPGAPPEIWNLVIIGVGCMVAIGVFKLIRG